MSTNVSCTNFLNTPSGPGHPGKFQGYPRFPPSKPNENKLSREGTNFSTPTPSRGRPPIPPGNLRAQKVNLCALLTCLNGRLAQESASSCCPGDREPSLTLGHPAARVRMPTGEFEPKSCCKGLLLLFPSFTPCSYGCGFFGYSWELPAYSGAFLLTIDNFGFFACNWSFFAYSFSFLTHSWSSFAYSGKVRLIRALRDCKQRSLTVSKKAPTVSKKASPCSYTFTQFL